MGCLFGLLWYLISGCRTLCIFVNLIVNRSAMVSSRICFKRCGNRVDMCPFCDARMSVRGVSVSKVCRTRTKMGCSLCTRNGTSKKSGLKREAFKGSRFTGVPVCSALTVFAHARDAQPGIIASAALLSSGVFSLRM